MAQTPETIEINELILNHSNITPEGTPQFMEKNFQNLKLLNLSIKYI